MYSMKWSSHLAELLPRVTEGVDAVELRVDLLSSTSADFVAQQIALLRRHCSLPIIYTVYISISFFHPVASRLLNPCVI